MNGVAKFAEIPSRCSSENTVTKMRCAYARTDTQPENIMINISVFFNLLATGFRDALKIQLGGKRKF